MKGASSTLAMPNVRACAILVSAVLITTVRWVPYPGFAPYWPLIVLHFWALYAPEELPLLLMIPLGIVQDLYQGEPLGLHALQMAALYSMTVSQRRFLLKQSFPVLWLNFSVILVGIILLFSIMNPFSEAKFDLDQIVFDLLFTALTYPFMFFVCAYVRQHDAVS
jgi:rod shape-determining protein MreD